MTTRSLRLNWQRRDVGRITRVSGERTRRGLSQAHALLDRLYDAGQYAVLADVRDGRVAMAQLRAWQRDGLLNPESSQLADQLVELRRVLDEIDRLLPRMGSPRTQGVYAKSFARLAKIVPAWDQLTLAGLAHVPWGQLLAEWSYAGATWNSGRGAVGRLLTLSLGRVHHPLRETVMQRFPVADATPQLVHLTLDRFAQLLAAIHRPDVRDIVLALAATGLRIGELLACQPSHVDPEARRLAIPTVTDADRRSGRVHREAATKTGGRIARVPAAFVPVLQRALPVTVRYDVIRWHFRRAAAAVGLDGLRLHDLRHFHAQQAVDGGAPLTAVSRQLGHSSLHMTMRYADHADAAAQAADTVGRSLLTLTGDTPR